MEMCTPIGHTILGLSILDRQKPGGWMHLWMPVLVIVIAANFPDIDFLFGWRNGNPNQYHQGWTHSILFVAVVLVPIWWFSRSLFAQYSLPGFQILALAMASHLLLDILGHDTRPPVGIPLFWPFSELRVKSPIMIFPAVHKASDSGLFIHSLFSLHNLKVAGVETGIIGGVYALFRVGRRRV
jgi:membrane-bound metal-dependent hydrolase YbcI (DUF457 family)